MIGKIELANDDVKEVSTSAQKISSRFHKIEKIEFKEHPDQADQVELLKMED